MQHSKFIKIAKANIQYRSSQCQIKTASKRTLKADDNLLFSILPDKLVAEFLKK